MTAGILTRGSSSWRQAAPGRLAGWHWGLAVAVATVAALPAFAQSPPDPQAETRRLFNEGVSALEREDYASALVAFQRAYEISPRPILLYNIGMCQRALMRFPEAIDAFRRYLRAAGPDAPADMRAQVEALLREMEAELGHVRISVNQSGAVILVDGREVGISPLLDPLPVGPGEHVVEARREGFRDARTTFDVMAGETVTVELRLEPLAAPPPPSRPPTPSGPTGERLPEGTLPTVSGVAATPDATPPDTRPREDDRGILSRWWFWTIIGVAIAGGAATTAVLLWPADEDPVDWSIIGR